MRRPDGLPYTRLPTWAHTHHIFSNNPGSIDRNRTREKERDRRLPKHPLFRNENCATELLLSPQDAQQNLFQNKTLNKVVSIFSTMSIDCETDEIKNI